MAVQSILLYEAPIWQRAMQIKKYKDIMKSTQRVMALRIYGAFRVIYYNAAIVIAGMTSIHILAEERKELYIDSITHKTEGLNLGK